MKIRKLHPLFLLFLAFVVVGLFQLILKPLELLSTILLYAVVILIFIAIYRYMINKQQQPNSKENVKFSSTNLFSSQKKGLSSHPMKKGKLKQNKKRTTNHPFTVIEGNKGKKKKPHSS